MADMSRTPLPKLALGLLLVGTSAALAGAGVVSLTTDAKVARVNAGPEQVVVPAVPPAAAVPPVGDEAFTRPMFNSQRALGPDKVPPAKADNADPSASDGAGNTPDAPGDMSAMTVRGIIISERGARAALQAPGAAALTWVKVGETVDGWNVESITASTVRISDGDKVVDLKVREDQ
jgi:hypothetical protein